MAEPVITKGTLLAYCVENNMTVDSLSTQVLTALCMGVPTDQVGFYGRCWSLLSELLDETRALARTGRYTDKSTCPSCGGVPLVTGGRNPHEYCPTCDIDVVDVYRDDGCTLRRWSTRGTLPQNADSVNIRKGE